MPINGNEFTANAKKVVELTAEIERLNRELKEAKAKVTNCMAEAGVDEYERGAYRAIITPKSRRTLQADRVEALFNITLTDACYKKSEYTELRVRAIA